MTAREHSRREDVNPSGHDDDDVQQIVTLLRQRSGSATVDYLQELSGFPELQLRACLDELKNAGRIDVHTGISSVQIELREQSDSDRPIVTDGSGRIADLDLDLRPRDVFDLLSPARRREMVRYMAALTPSDEVGETHIELRELATVITAGQVGSRPADLNHEERHRVYIALCQNHAEALDEFGVSTYHRRVKKITATADVLALAEIVEEIEAASTGGTVNVERE
jgi:hypothetical protein